MDSPAPLGGSWRAVRQAANSAPEGCLIVERYTFGDDPTIDGRENHADWRSLVASMDQTDLVLVGSAGDLSGRSVADLLKTLGILSVHGVGLCLHREGIRTDDGAATILALIIVYRALKRSEAIKRGNVRAKDRGKAIGRPKVPIHMRRQLQTALSNGAGIRPTARPFKVSPATVINIRRMMDTEVERWPRDFEGLQEAHNTVPPFFMDASMTVKDGYWSVECRYPRISGSHRQH